MLCTYEDIKIFFHILEIISKFILFQISERQFLVCDVTPATDNRPVDPYKHTHLEQFILTAIVSLQLPGEFKSDKPKN